MLDIYKNLSKAKIEIVHCISAIKNYLTAVVTQTYSTNEKIVGQQYFDETVGQRGNFLKTGTVWPG